jgi:hypothetical protein
MDRKKGKGRDPIGKVGKMSKPKEKEGWGLKNIHLFGRP